MNDIDYINSYKKLLVNIINDFIEEYSNQNPNDFINYLDMIINNPLSSNDKIIKLIEFINKNQNNTNQKFNWKFSKKFIQDYYINNIKVKTPFFKGKLRQLEIKTIDLLSHYAESKGVRKAVATINCYLLIHKNLSQSEIKELTGLSKGAISKYINQLVKIGFIKKQLIRGTRTYNYTLGSKISEIYNNVTLIKRETGIDIENHIEKLIQKLNEKKLINDVNIIPFLDRIKELKDYLKTLRNITDEILLQDPIMKILK